MSQTTRDSADSLTPMPPSNLVLIGSNGCGGKHYIFAGSIHFGGWHGADLEAGDSITDAGGKGITVYVHACIECGKLFLRTLITLVPISCDSCDAKNYLRRSLLGQWFEDFEDHT
ncbi:MAG: hypothetical protein HS103_06305 [Anaerolineales bacterium]|nr:hypothetical protein [Anaerolineales bacterium]